MSIYFWFQFALLIAFLFISAPRGGMFLGLFSGIGLIVIMFGPKPWLGLPPGKPPVDVILTIIAVVAQVLHCRLPAAWTACFRSLKRF